MFFLNIALQALIKTRELLKPSLKSDNKKYVHWPHEEWQATAEERKKWARRNENQEKVESAFVATGPSVVPISGMTVLEAGQALYNRAVSDAATWYGNCGEQSLIALYLCYKYGAAPEYLYQFTYVRGNFGHSLVVLADSKNRNDPRPACCDPWMDIACYFDDYKDEADVQLQEWTRQGKRLKYGTIGAGIFNRTNWVEPSNAAILGFAADQPSSTFNANDRPTANTKRN